MGDPTPATARVRRIPRARARRAPLPVVVGANIRFERSRRGWSQEKLAQLAGLSRETIRRIEAGRLDEGYSMTLSTLEHLAVAMTIEPSTLLVPNQEALRVKRGGNPLGSPRQLELIPGEGTDNQPIQSPLTRVH